MNVIFVAKNPFKTWSLRVSHDPKAEQPAFDALETDMLKVGWTQPFPSVPAIGASPEETDFSKTGTDLFGGWTPLEAKQFMSEVKQVLAGHGFKNVTKKKMRLEDLI